MYVTVSHASGFTTDVPTVFRGKGDAVHVFPLSFAEFMSGFDGGLHEAWAQYSRYGGMPAVVALESEEEVPAHELSQGHVCGGRGWLL